MRVFDTRKKNIAYFIYRIGSPIFDPIRFVRGIAGYGWYMRDLINYKLKDPSAKLLGINLFPILSDKTVLHDEFDPHYFYQQLWVFENVLKAMPSNHVDIASRYEMVGYISKITKATFVDIRPFKAKLKNLNIEKGNILKLPYKNNSINSLSCLHVVEHIGLGRYGDPIDPKGTEKACRELSRVLHNGGFLYFSVPMGREKICFNAHRILSPRTVLSYFSDLKLVSFSVVDDEGNFHEKVDYKDYKNLNYGCGLFIFTKDSR